MKKGSDSHRNRSETTMKMIRAAAESQRKSSERPRIRSEKTQDVREAGKKKTESMDNATF